MLPLLLEPAQLENHLGQPELLIVDLCNPKTYPQCHIPGAVHLDYSQLVAGQKPAPGLMPDKAKLQATLSALGLTPDRHVVAYDDEGSGRACRLLWTLDVLGHQPMSLLNGGLHAWVNEGHPQGNGNETGSVCNYPVHIGNDGIADLAYVMKHLHDPGVALLDARTPNEYVGANVRALRGGHIPGAVNFNWLDAIDQTRNLRFKTDEVLRSMLAERHITSDKEVIVYCQTHHRSSHSYIMLKHLEYKQVRGYPGSWSEWGNHPDTPIERLSQQSERPK